VEKTEVSGCIRKVAFGGRCYIRGRILDKVYPSELFSTVVECFCILLYDFMMLKLALRKKKSKSYAICEKKCIC